MYQHIPPTVYITSQAQRVSQEEEERESSRAPGMGTCRYTKLLVLEVQIFGLMLS